MALAAGIFEATGANVEDLSKEHGHRVLRVHGKGDKIVLVPLPPAVSCAIERAMDDRTTGPRTTMRYDRARNNLDRHANCILAAYMAAGT
jgi:hypothetical protein